MFQLSEILIFPFFAFHARFLIGGFRRVSETAKTRKIGSEKDLE